MTGFHIDSINHTLIIHPTDKRLLRFTIQYDCDCNDELVLLIRNTGCPCAWEYCCDGVEYDYTIDSCWNKTLSEIKTFKVGILDSCECNECQKHYIGYYCGGKRDTINVTCTYKDIYYDIASNHLACDGPYRNSKCCNTED